MRPLLALIFVAAAGAALAQDPPPDGRRNQKIERIRIEDGGNRIDEVRVGGQTQSVTVQPKGGAPAYEIQPTDLARSRPADARDNFSGASGKRVWNVLDF